MKLRLNRKVCIIAFITAGVLLLAVLLIVLLPDRETPPAAAEDFEYGAPDDGRLYIDGICYVPNKDLEAILIMGVDKYGSQTQTDSYNNDQQSDFLMLLLMDKKAETCRALHLNRDTMAEIPTLGVRGEKAGSITGQLALAHTYGSGGADSCRNTAEAVSNLLYGVDIDHYVAFTMDAVQRINDLAGGVTVTVLDDMTSVSPAMSKGARLTLTGDMALSYVRARQGLEDSSNLRRMERQRQYLNGLRDALSAKTASDEAFLLEALDAVSTCMTSDCTVNQLSQLYDRWTQYGDGGFLTLEGDAKNGAEFVEFYPDEAALKQLVTDLFYLPLEE